MARQAANKIELPWAGRNVIFDEPYLYPKQKAAIFDQRRYSVIEATTKAGKTSGCIVWLHRQALGGRPGQNFWWIAPVSDQTKIAFSRMMRAIPQDRRMVNLSDRVIRLENETAIWFKSGDKADSLYGEDVYAAVVDEASRFKEDAWYAIRSTLTATEGPVRIIGNVKGRKNWFYKLARHAEKGLDPAMGYHKLIAHDAIEAGVLNEEEVEDARLHLPEHVFKELYLAQPADDEGNPFGGEAIRRCIKPLSEKEPYVWGWDLAKSVDYTVGIALDRDGDVCRFERFHRVPWGDIKRNILWHTKHKPSLVDSTGVGDPIVEELQNAPGSKAEGYHFTPGSKQQLMEGLASAIQSGKVGFPEGPISQELADFEYTYTKFGVRYSAPEGMFDDCVCALALAVMHKARVVPQMVIPPGLANRLRASPPSRHR